MDYVTGETFIIDKPLRWTSFDVVKRLRAEITRRTGLRKVKVGHAGTLDPLATGLMIVVTGRRTKLIETLQSGVKEYMATLALGSTTPSFDLETEIDATYPTDHITTGLIDDVLSRFRGAIEQVPPLVLGLQNRRHPRLSARPQRRRSETQSQDPRHRRA